MGVVPGDKAIPGARGGGAQPLAAACSNFPDLGEQGPGEEGVKVVEGASGSQFAENFLKHSGFVAGINDFKLELPALEGHQHTAKIFPRDFPAIDHE